MQMFWRNERSKTLLPAAAKNVRGLPHFRCWCSAMEGGLDISAAVGMLFGHANACLKGSHLEWVVRVLESLAKFR